jgi:hypothetical protein
MDIHPPHGPIHSKKDFLLHLLTITIGILIALSLEGIVEWRHHRALVHEAEENLRNEILDNKKELDGKLKTIPEREKERQHILDVIRDVLSRKKLHEVQINLTSNHSDLSVASWNTAEHTGALALMGYAQVKKYSEAYGAQQQFNQLQDKELESTIAALQMFRAGADPNKLSDRELEAEKQQIMTTLAFLLAEKQVGQQLSDKYAKVLAKD